MESKKKFKNFSDGKALRELIQNTKYFLIVFGRGLPRPRQINNRITRPIQRKFGNISVEEIMSPAGQYGYFEKNVFKILVGRAKRSEKGSP